ncbi:MAG: exodeoxyribonuclease VII large subunit [Chloroflexi bacterium]|nr:exodeoxyribonuclease VII large subunit [Chloroflexota bacterium]
MFEQPALFQSLSFSVTEVTHYVRTLLEKDELLGDIWVRGEISNLARPRSGHIYFTLKDASASLRGVVWRSNIMRMPANLRDGMEVEAHGSIGVYERDGQYQLYADFIREAGEGLLYQEFLRLKEKLEAEGLFAEEKKRPVPERPKKIGIVTSRTAAALQDVLNILRQRSPWVEVFLSPAAVQGDESPPEIVRALERLNRLVKPDVILLVRGGGSLEDLWAFNDERVVRAVAASEAPVISGVGHETDFTLVDFCADLRAPTPTGAAVRAAPDRSELLGELVDQQRRLSYALEDWLTDARNSTNASASHLQSLSPRWRVQNDHQRLDGITERLYTSVLHRQQTRRMAVQNCSVRLENLNPLAVLKRGYSLVFDANGSLVQSYKQVQPEERIDIHLADGRLSAKVSTAEGTANAE